MSLQKISALVFSCTVAAFSSSCERDIDAKPESGKGASGHSIEVFNVPYDDGREFEWYIEFPSRDELEEAGSIVFDESDILGVEEAGSSSHHRFVFRERSIPRLLEFLESTERGMIFVAVDGECIEASLGGCWPCRSIDGTFPPESIELINTILAYEPRERLSGGPGPRQAASALSSGSNSDGELEPEPEGRPR